DGRSRGWNAAPAVPPAARNGHGPRAHPVQPPRVSRLAEAALPTRSGAFRIVAFQVDGAAAETLALVHGEPASATAPLVRLHSECLTGEALGSLRCDCGDQLET